jgi:hypothetical protein
LRRRVHPKNDPGNRIEAQIGIISPHLHRLKRGDDPFATVERKVRQLLREDFVSFNEILLEK